MWSAKLTDAQRDALLTLLRDHPECGPALEGAREALDLARWDDLPDAALPWGEVSVLAKAQGIGEADVVWDLASGLPPRFSGSSAHRPGGPAG